jgi:hypothetical protein
LRGRLDDPLTELAEEVAVAGRRAAAAVDGRSLRLVQKDEVEIAVIVRFATAELPQGQDDELTRLSHLRRLRRPARKFARRVVAQRADRWLAELFDELGRFGGGNLFEAGLGDVGERGMRILNVVFADNVANADAKMLGMFEAKQNRFNIFGPAR